MSQTPITWNFTANPSAFGFGPQTNSTQVDIGLDATTPVGLYGNLPSSIPPSLSAKAWTPTSLYSPIVWLDAADYGTFQFTSGTSIGTWRNKGSATDATAGATKPVYNATGLNNLPSVQFTGNTGVSDSSYIQGTMSGAAINTGAYLHAFIVCSVTNKAGTPTQYSRILSLARNGVSDVVEPTTCLAFGRNQSSQAIYTNRNTGDNFPNPSPFGTPLIAEVYNEPSNCYIALNGSPIPPPRVATGTTANFNIDKYSIGIEASYPGAGSGTFTFFEGFVSEVLYYKDQMSLAQICTVEGYLAWKWGLQANLPNVHPFKNFPPSPS